jgi:receptor protein-tyrosine kinase
MERLLAEFAADRGETIVIFDAPPLLLANDAEVLANRVGQAVLVIEAEQTPRTSVVQALAALEPCPIVTTLLNKSPRAGRPTAYQYEDSR